MASKQSLLTFRDGMTFSDLQRTVAERDDLLAQYYVGRERYVDRALNREDEASVFIGPKGVGKSAVLQMVRLDQESRGNTGRVIEIAPDDLAFNALVNVQSRTPLLNRPGDNQWLFTSLWDYVFSVELLRRESPSKGGVASILKSLFGTKHELEQKKLLQLTLNDDGTQSTMTDKMLALVHEIELEGTYGDVNVTAKVELEDSALRSSDLKLLQLINNVAKSLPQTIKHEYFILIDDLDLHWTGSPLQNAFLGAMFFSIRKLSRASHIKFVASMRERIFREIELEERDKFSPLVCKVRWDREAVLEMVYKRIAFPLKITPQKIIKSLFPPNAFDRMLDCTDGMPRESIRVVVRIISEAVSNGSYSVTEKDMNDGIVAFSKDRLDDLASEYLRTYPSLSIVLRQFAGGHKDFNIEHVRESAFKVADIESQTGELQDTQWATCGVDDPLSFTRSLLRTRFLMLKDGRTSKPRFATEHEILMLDEEKWYSIHPMYAPGLGLAGT